MKVGILGTGTVGRTLAARLGELGHDVMHGTRDPKATQSRSDADVYGNPPFRIWSEDHPDIGLGSFAEAAHELVRRYQAWSTKGAPVHTWEL